VSIELVWGDLPKGGQDAVKGLLECLKSVDPATYEHCLRVGEYSKKLARDLGLNEFQQKIAEYSGLLHDIGKMGIEKAVLLKPSRLDQYELELMKTHSCISEQIVKPLAEQQFFAQLLPAIRGHHERVDGAGYPDKKSGDDISLYARVILVVDTYDAMSVDRVYRKGLPEEAVFAELKKCSGTQFDSHIVKTFLEAIPFWKQESDEDTYHQIIKKIA
jgi:putative nucleotidyltransferase with HDIG domain